MSNDKKLGAIYGALIGDAVGCPYEFKRSEMLPHIDDIDMTPPSWWRCTYPEVPLGTYTDDGAQTLCLLETLAEFIPSAVHMMQSPEKAAAGARSKDYQWIIEHLRGKLSDWLNSGYMSVDNITFDVGNQTRDALGVDSAEDVYAGESSNGNGSLMRCIPVAVMAKSEDEAIHFAMAQSRATHPHIFSQLVCAAYSLIGYWSITTALPAEDFIIPAFSLLQKTFPEQREALAYIYNCRYTEPTGTGFVVDSFWSALWALHNGKDFKGVIKQAISLGHDTDTTACIAGGLAGIKYGFSGLPASWLNKLRNKELVNSLCAAAKLGVDAE